MKVMLRCYILLWSECDELRGLSINAVRLIAHVTHKLSQFLFRRTHLLQAEAVDATYNIRHFIVLYGTHSTLDNVQFSPARIDMNQPEIGHMHTLQEAIKRRNMDISGDTVHTTFAIIRMASNIPQGMSCIII